MNEQELIYCMALTRLDDIGLITARKLLDRTGSAAEVFANAKDIRAIVPDATDRLRQAFSNTGKAVAAAQRELEAMQRLGIRAMTLSDDNYPQRLLECDDAPIVLFNCGTTDFNRQHVVNMIGTRKCTEYGRELCQNFVADLKRLVPNALVVSGLAYGIDIQSHRAALEQQMDTAAVLAHGLDIIYPYAHRKTAADIVHSGGALLTEYPTGTRPEAHNFVHRNRIVAGMCDACIVVESAAKGGSLITARMALDYNREVFAFPGKVYDECSAGCNNLIHRHEATLITYAEDFAVEMGWHTPEAKAKKTSGKGNTSHATQPDLFPTLSPAEKTVVEALATTEGIHINQLSVATSIPHTTLSATLFELEMKGIVKALGGSRYRMTRQGLAEPRNKANTY